MNCQEYLNEMKNIQENLLDFIENKEINDEILQTFTKLFDDLKIYDNHHKLKSLLHLIASIANYHHRGLDFFNKIFQIILILKPNIKSNFSNWSIFKIFSQNKRILLFLIEEQIITIDEQIAKEITTNFTYTNEFLYPQYFQPEIKPYMTKFWFRNESSLEIEIPEEFYELRKKGENENVICELIREDRIEDFIVYVNRNSIQLNTKICRSIYETNSILMQYTAYDSLRSLIEYAAFYGSIQIFKYLLNKGVNLTPDLWYFAICSQNDEIIQLLEENNVSLINDSYMNAFLHSIDCHHINISHYLLNNYFQNEENSLDTLKQSLFSYNFAFMQSNLINESLFINLCESDYYILVDFLLKSGDVDINRKEILYKNLLFLIGLLKINIFLNIITK